MELGESHRVSDTDRNKLVAAKVQRQLAEKERDKVEEKCLQACQQREIFRKEAEEAKGQLNTLEVYVRELDYGIVLCNVSVTVTSLYF